MRPESRGGWTSCQRPSIKRGKMWKASSGTAQADPAGCPEPWHACSGTPARLPVSGPWPCADFLYGFKAARQAARAAASARSPSLPLALPLTSIPGRGWGACDRRVP